MLKVFLLSACLLLVSAADAAPPAFLTPSEMRAEATRLGFPTEDVQFRVEEADTVNAFFVPEGVYCFLWVCEEWPTTTLVFVGDWSSTPYELRLTVLLHELGHYRQHLEGRPFDEWDADVFAADTMCRRGADGVYWIGQVGLFLIKRSGQSWSDGGPQHGSWAQRVENVRANALACQGVQTP